MASLCRLNHDVSSVFTSTPVIRSTGVAISTVAPHDEGLIWLTPKRNGQDGIFCQFNIDYLVAHAGCNFFRRERLDRSNQPLPHDLGLFSIRHAQSRMLSAN